MVRFEGAEECGSGVADEDALLWVQVGRVGDEGVKMCWGG